MCSDHTIPPCRPRWLGIRISYADPVDLHSPACLILLSPASLSLSHSLALSPPLPPQFPQHLTGQGIAAHLTQGGLAQVFFAPPAAYVDKIRLSLTLPSISCLIRMSKKKGTVPCLSTPFCRLDALLHNTDNCCIFHQRVKH